MAGPTQPDPGRGTCVSSSLSGGAKDTPLVGSGQRTHHCGSETASLRPALPPRRCGKHLSVTASGRSSSVPHLALGPSTRPQCSAWNVFQTSKCKLISQALIIPLDSVSFGNYRMQRVGTVDGCVPCSRCPEGSPRGFSMENALPKAEITSFRIEIERGRVAGSLW